MLKTNKNTITVILLNLFWFSIIAFLSYRMPSYVDDYLHRTSFYDGTTIQSLAQIFPSVKTYYMTWGGRAVSMFFIQLMLMLPKPVFVICNGVIYVLVANVIYQYAQTSFAKRDIDVVELSVIYLFLWFFMPDFAEVVTWITGSVTYLWTNLLILTFGLFYYKDYRNCSKKEINPFLSASIYVALGFLAGLSNEAGACTLVFALLVFMIYKICNKKQISIQQILGAVSAIVGAAILMLAPGNFVRSADAASTSASTNIIVNYCFRIGRESFYTFMLLLIPLALVVGLMAYKFHCGGTRPDTDKCSVKGQRFVKFRNISNETIFCILAFVSIYVLTFAAGFANRIFQLPLLLLCISLATSLKEILNAVDVKNNVRKALTVMVLVLTIMAIFEVVAGTLYSTGKESFYDRQTIYYHIYDTEGVISGNGL